MTPSERCANLISRDAIELLIKFQRDYRAKHKREATDAELAAEAERMIRTHGAK